MLGFGIIVSIISAIGFIVALIWLVIALVSENRASRRKALKLLVFSALGLLISFPLCTMGWNGVDFK